MKRVSFVVVVACLSMLVCAREPAAIPYPEIYATFNPSIGQDGCGHVLKIKVGDFAKAYAAHSPIPVTVRITNLGSIYEDRPQTAQLFPHLTVWVKHDSKTLTERVALPIENRIRIEKGESFERSIDLSRMNLLSAPGEYDVSIGHWNYKVLDIGDWMGTLRSRSQTIEIKAERTEDLAKPSSVEE